MKKYGRFLIVYLAIVTLLYGTTNVMPVIVRKDRAYYTSLKGTLNNPSGGYQTAGGSVEQGQAYSVTKDPTWTGTGVSNSPFGV